MIRPCVVSFAPGSRGNFIGHVCQYILHGTSFEILDNGSCHFGKVINWGQAISINDSADSIVAEIQNINQNLPVTKNVVVTHSRNLRELSKHFFKTVWISFKHEDIGALINNYRPKNNNLVYEHNYNNIKDETWPDYADFMAGKISQQLLDEIHHRLYVDPYTSWTWFVPADLVGHRIYQLEFSKILEATADDVYNLCTFIDPEVTQSTVDYLIQKWNEYKNKQPQS